MLPPMIPLGIILHYKSKIFITKIYFEFFLQFLPNKCNANKLLYVKNIMYFLFTLNKYTF